MAEIEFIYNGEKVVIHCELKEKMKNICQKFKEKAMLGNNKVFYSYDGKVGFNEEITFVETANSEDKKRNKMSILVYENEIKIKEKDIVKSRNIICPECKENIKMDIKDYKINLFDCKNGHKINNILLNQFDDKQKIDRLNIICDACKKFNKSTSYKNMFFKCFTCNKNICPLCQTNHDANHQIINYDEKNYICNKHNEYFISYCEKCNQNLCTSCDGHKNHNRIFFSDVLPKKGDLIELKNYLKSYVDLFNNDLNMLINLLNVLRIILIYIIK